MKCIILARIDDTFREEIHAAFKMMRVEYQKKLMMMNDDFKYVFDCDRLRDRLYALLMDERYHSTKANIIENVVRITEILDLNSDVYMVKRSENLPTDQLRECYRMIIARCINPYLEVGMMRHQLNVTLYFDGSLLYLKTPYVNSVDYNSENYRKYIYDYNLGQDAECFLNDITDVRGHLDINLEKIETLMKQKVLSHEIIDNFNGNAEIAGVWRCDTLNQRQFHYLLYYDFYVCVLYANTLRTCPVHT
jgi:hypothetical protein